MADKIKNPLPEPKKKPHSRMEFDLPDEEIEELSGDNAMPAILQEDDFDIRIPDGDDFDLP